LGTGEERIDILCVSAYSLTTGITVSFGEKPDHGAAREEGQGGVPAVVPGVGGGAVVVSRLEEGKFAIPFKMSVSDWKGI
jgi:hypothetical protein